MGNLEYSCNAKSSQLVELIRDELEPNGQAVDHSAGHADRWVTAEVERGEIDDCRHYSFEPLLPRLRKHGNCRTGNTIYTRERFVHPVVIASRAYRARS